VAEFSVRDGVRTLEFDGVKLSESSSRLPNKPRWVEFNLYRTPKGQYVVSRIGYSIFYHSRDCFTVSRNNLAAVDGLTLSGDYVACDKCQPDRANTEGVFPETPRYAAWVCSEPVAVISSLMKEDDNGTEYLTNVARRLLIDASKIDTLIHGVFYTDRIE
jgi:hypothetical protein